MIPFSIALALTLAHGSPAGGNEAAVQLGSISMPETVGAEALRRARVRLARVVAAEPRNIAARADLGTVLARLGYRSEAEEQLRALRTMQEACASRCPEAGLLRGRTDALLTLLALSPSLSTAPPPARARGQ